MSAHFSDQKLEKLYWLMRLGMAFLWAWTAITSWYFYPHAESFAWLRQVGLTEHLSFWLATSCLFDLSMGIASALFPSRRLWQIQLVVTIFYTLVLVTYLSEFLLHPFGPITKNINVLACLAFLIAVEKR